MLVVVPAPASGLQHVEAAEPVVVPAPASGLQHVERDGTERGCDCRYVVGSRANVCWAGPHPPPGCINFLPSLLVGGAAAMPRGLCPKGCRGAAPPSSARRVATRDTDRYS